MHKNKRNKFTVNYVKIKQFPRHRFIFQITGTGHGIGKELALLYASEGATVVGWDINEENNKKTMEEIANKNYPKAYSYV